MPKTAGLSWTGRPPRCRSTRDVREFYLGLSAAGRKSYRDVKHNRHRKRWLA
jgi:branched-chain amino acid transport system ATP-binding protein